MTDVEREATVAVAAKLRFAEGDVERAVLLLSEIIEKFRRHEGCLAYDLSRDCSDPGLLRVSEFWTSMEALNHHSAHPDVTGWHAALRECRAQDARYVVSDLVGVKVLTDVQVREQ